MKSFPSSGALGQHLSSGHTSAVPSPNLSDLSRARRTAIVILLGITITFANSVSAMIGPIFPLKARAAFPQKADHDAVILGLLLSTGTLSFTIAASITGRELRVSCPKRIAVLGTVLKSGATVLFSCLSLMKSWSMFLGYGFALRACQGMAGGVVYTSIYALLASILPNALSSVMAAIEMFIGFGFVIGPIIGGALYEKSGFSTPFLLLGLLLGAAAAAQCVLLPVTGNSREEGDICSPLRILAEPRALFILFLTSLAGSALDYCQPILSPFLVDHFGMRPTSVGSCYVVAQAAKSIFAVLVGRFADKYRRLPIFLIGLVLTSLGFFLMGFKGISGENLHIGLFLFGYGLSGVGAAFTLVPTSAEIACVMHERGFPDSFSFHGTIGGLVGAAKTLGMGVAPTVASALAKSFSFWWACLILAALLAATSSILTLMVVREIWTARGAERPTSPVSDQSGPILLRSFRGGASELGLLLS